MTEKKEGFGRVEILKTGIVIVKTVNLLIKWKGNILR